MEARADAKDGGTARKLAALLGGLSAALLAATVALFLRPPRTSGEIDLQAALADPRVRASVIAQLVEGSSGVFDSHPDADVGRILIPGLRDVDFSGSKVSSNDLGLRERDFALPKPEGTCRVVLLGDSYVFGLGVEAQDRMGVFLESMLCERAGAADLPIEVLHVGIGSWSAFSECQFLRRQLSDYAPDLVVQIIVSNDLDDTAGIRGFGARSSFTDRYRQRADATVSRAYTRPFAGVPNMLNAGVDHESRGRYEELAGQCARLAAAVERQGGRYVLLCHWGRGNARLDAFVRGRLREDQLAFLPPVFETDLSLRISRLDTHWNRAGHERVAGFLYGLVRVRDLLPRLSLSAWPEIEERAAESAELALSLARNGPEEDEWGQSRPLTATLSFGGEPGVTFGQVHTGVDGAGRASPYASILLENVPGGRLSLRGRAFERPEIDGARLRVAVDGSEVGALELVAGRALVLDAELPASTAGERCVTVELSCDDWVYVDLDRRHCVSYRLDALAIVR